MKANYMKEFITAWWINIKASFCVPFGIWRLSRLKQPLVSIFGGKGAHRHGKFTDWAYNLSYRIAKENMSVLTGGGPGIMEAGNCGAFDGAGKHKGNTLGIGVRGLDEQFQNKCIHVMLMDHFYLRKWLLIRYSSAYVFFPGGIGTADELFELLNLIKLQRLKKAPIILMDSSYWKYLIEWYKHAYDYELITIPLENILIMSDSIDDAMDTIRSIKDTHSDTV